MALGLSLACAVTKASDLTEQKKPCSAAQKSTLDKGFADAKGALSKAIASLKAPAESDVKRQELWFGAMSSAAAEQVRKVYERALATASFAQYWCPLTNDVSFKWESGDLAAVHPSAPGEMFFTPAFFKLAVKGADSQMGTIIHELTHLVGVGIRPEIYGPNAVKALATGDAAKSKNNSDNFQYYVEDLTFGVP